MLLFITRYLLRRPSYWSAFVSFAGRPLQVAVSVVVGFCFQMQRDRGRIRRTLGCDRSSSRRGSRLLACDDTLHCDKLCYHFMLLHINNCYIISINLWINFSAQASFVKCIFSFYGVSFSSLIIVLSLKECGIAICIFVVVVCHYYHLLLLFHLTHVVVGWARLAQSSYTWSVVALWCFLSLKFLCHFKSVKCWQFISVRLSPRNRFVPDREANGSFGGSDFGGRAFGSRGRVFRVSASTGPSFRNASTVAGDESASETIGLNFAVMAERHVLRAS